MRTISWREFSETVIIAAEDLAERVSRNLKKKAMRLRKTWHHHGSEIVDGGDGWQQSADGQRSAVRIQHDVRAIKKGSCGCATVPP